MTHDLLDALRVLMRDVAAVCTDEGQELELAPAMYQAAMAIERTTGEETTMQANSKVQPASSE